MVMLGPLLENRQGTDKVPQYDGLVRSASLQGRSGNETMVRHPLSAKKAESAKLWS